MSEVVLPEGWVKVKVADVTIKGEQRKPAPEESITYIDIGSIDRELKKIATPQFLIGSEAPSRARKEVNTGDVLVSLTRPNLNAVALVPPEYAGQIASTGFEVIKPIGIESRYIFGLVRSRSFIDTISGKVQGALYPAAKSTDVQSYEFGLPPLAEQKEIAARLDELLAQVDSIKNRLDAIPDIIKRFRQSVLAAAVSGRLTEEWRETNQNSLMSQKQFNESIQSIFETKSKVEKKRVIKAKESEWFYNRGNELPRGWVQANLIDVTSLITCGVAKKPDYVENGIPFLSAQNSKPFAPNLNKIKYVRDSDFKTFTVGGKPERGDVLYSRVGANFGQACVIPWDFDFAIYVSLTLIKPCVILDSRYLTIFLNSIDGVLQSHGGIMGSGIQNLNVENVRKYKILLSSIEEQTEIVRRVEQLFTFADQIEQRVKDAQSRVNNLTQSILAKAFRGELTADWREHNPDLISGENSAEALLEKIKSEREVLESTKKAVKRKKAKV